MGDELVAVGATALPSASTRISPMPLDVDRLINELLSVKGELQHIGVGGVVRRMARVSGLLPQSVRGFLLDGV